MRPDPSLLWTWPSTIDRIPYLLTGVFLFLVKYAIDWTVATQGFGSRPGRQAPARTPEPALGVTPHLDEDPAPWEGLAPQVPQTPALQDRPPAEPPAPAPAAPRRRGGAHAARHGKPSRRSRGDG